MDRKDKSEYLSGDENARGRGDLGDAGGSQVGRPTPAPREAAEPGASKKGPSSSTTKEGLEGAVLNEIDSGDRQSMGSGAEAARGLHAKQGMDRSTGSGTGEEAGGSPRGGSERHGSEPLGREREHKSSYGGEGGAPRTSSDKREPQTPE